jgi:hypothetical protein
MKQILTALFLLVAIASAQGQQTPRWSKPVGCCPPTSYDSNSLVFDDGPVAFGYYVRASSVDTNYFYNGRKLTWQSVCDSLMPQWSKQRKLGGSLPKYSSADYPGEWLDLLDTTLPNFDATGSWRDHVLRIKATADTETIELKGKLVGRGLRSGKILWIDLQGYREALEFVKKALGHPVLDIAPADGKGVPNGNAWIDLIDTTHRQRPTSKPKPMSLDIAPEPYTYKVNWDSARDFLKADLKDTGRPKPMAVDYAPKDTPYLGVGWGGSSWWELISPFQTNLSWVSFRLSDKKSKRWAFDSGAMTIRGDTLRLIRIMAKDLDSVHSRYWNVPTYVEKLIKAACEVMDTRDHLRYDGKRIINDNAAEQAKKMDAFVAAVKKYRAFVYGKPKTKGGIK